MRFSEEMSGMMERLDKEKQAELLLAYARRFIGVYQYFDNMLEEENLESPWSENREGYLLLRDTLEDLQEDTFTSDDFFSREGLLEQLMPRTEEYGNVEAPIACAAASLVLNAMRFKMSRLDSFRNRFFESLSELLESMVAYGMGQENPEELQVFDSLLEGMLSKERVLLGAGIAGGNSIQKDALYQFPEFKESVKV
jgi:hypothetical protein